MEDLIWNISGWIGAILVLAAYILLSLKKISNGRLYQIMNLAAALFMAIGLIPKDAWFSFAVQVIWGIVAIIALLKMRKTPKAKTKKS